MTRHKLSADSTVAVVSGRDIKPELFGYQSHVPANKNFIFFYIVPDSLKPAQFKRLLICNRGQEGTGEKCEHARMDFSKFFDHLRTHSGERPFVCPIEDCKAQFSFKGNLNRHMVVHESIQKFVCPHCDQRFSLKQNLQKHMLRRH